MQRLVVGFSLFFVKEVVGFSRTQKKERKKYIYCVHWCINEDRARQEGATMLELSFDKNIKFDFCFYFFSGYSGQTGGRYSKD